LSLSVATRLHNVLLTELSEHQQHGGSPDA
jgi:hypothetical protein